MRPLKTLSGSLTDSSEEDRIRSDLTQENGTQQPAFSNNHQPKRKSVSKLSDAKRQRREHFIPVHSLPISPPSPNLDARLAGVGPEASREESDRSVIEQTQSMEQRLESRILSSIENRLGDIIENRISQVMQERVDSNSQQEVQVKDPRTGVEEDDIYGVSKSLSPVPRGSKRISRAKAITSQRSEAEDLFSRLRRSESPHPGPQGSKLTPQAKGPSSQESQSPFSPFKRLEKATTAAKATTKSRRQSEAAIPSDPSSSTPNDEPRQGIPLTGMPVFVQRLPPLQNYSLPKTPETFSHKQIIALLGGGKLANHVWAVKNPKAGLSRRIQGYYLMDPEIQPFGPSRPGQHGAAIVSTMIWVTSVEEGKDLPLFVKNGEGLYTYFGQYIEPRYSDTISYNEQETVIPPYIKKWHAKDLSRKTNGYKSKNVIEALKDQSERCRVPMTDEEAEAIDYEEIMKAFDRADFDDKPSLRLYWEYLQAVSFDKEFYLSMKAQKHKLGV